MPSPSRSSTPGPSSVTETTPSGGSKEANREQALIRMSVIFDDKEKFQLEGLLSCAEEASVPKEASAMTQLELLHPTKVFTRRECGQVKAIILGRTRRLQ